MLAVSIAAAIDGVIRAAAVVDVQHGDVFSAAQGDGARLNDGPITASQCADLSQSLVTTGFSYRAAVRAARGDVVGRILPLVRDVRCFGSAALQSAGGVPAPIRTSSATPRCGTTPAASLVAAEAGAVVELPCPENRGLAIATAPAVFDSLRQLVDETD